MEATIKINGQTISSTQIDFNSAIASHHRGTVLRINTHDYKIGFDDGSVLTINRTEMADPDFSVDDVVEIYRDGSEFILRPIDAPVAHARKRPAYEYNKGFFVWFGTFFGGFFGIDRFMRGQIGIGLAKIFFGPCTVYIWNFVDWLVALRKAYYGPYANRKNLTFDPAGEYMH